MISPTTASLSAIPGLSRVSPALFTALLCLAWILPGLVGHDPWKPDEAYSFGLVYHILQTGDWITPTLAHEPFMEKPPLFYISAALFAQAFDWLLPLHDAARLTAGFYMAITLVAVALTVRELFGQQKGWLGVLLLISNLGLVERCHQLITDVSQLTGFALAFYGLALSLRRPIAGGTILGTGVGIGFMSKGLLAPGCMGILCLILPVMFSPWRTRAHLQTLCIAFVACLPWLALWPWLLYQRSPELFHEWFWVNNLGRFLGDNNLGPKALPGQYLAILPWYAFPTWPLALWALWVGRRELRANPALHLPLSGFLVILAVLSASRDARDLYALPMLLPLSMLAVPGVLALRRGAINASWWFSILFFALFASVAWFYWVAMDLRVPAGLHAKLMSMQPDYVAQVEPLKLVLALLYTSVWIVVLLRLKRSLQRPLVAWATGVTMVWGLLLIMFVEYADTGKSYRSMILSIERALPARYACISARNLGEPQRALLHYFADIITHREEVDVRRGNCDVLLVQGFHAQIYEPDENWRKIWEGARPGDKRELYRLYQRRG